MFQEYRKAFLSTFAVAALGLSMLATAACSAVSPTVTSLSLNNSQVQTSQQHETVKYTFKTHNDAKDPTFNQLLGINNNGKIAGYFGSGADGHPNKGYRLSSPYGPQNFHDENFPGSVQTQVTAINNDGQTAGFWVDGNGNNFGFIDWNGHFTSYREPNIGTGTVTQLLGLNKDGIAVGFYTDGAGVNHAFKLNSNNGKFTELVPPNGVSVTATGINDRGDISGFYTDALGNTDSFLLKDHHFTQFSYPQSTNTQAFGLNNADQLVGVYTDGAKNMHGFVASHIGNHARFQSIDDPTGVGTTTANGINDHGDLVGFYVDGAGNTDGFLAKPVDR